MNQLSREIVEGRYTVEEAWERLEAIKQMPGKKNITRILASGVGSASFCYVLGGGIWDAAAAFLSGFLLYVLLVALEKREKKTSKIVLNLLGGFWASFLAVVFYRLGIGENYGSILVGSIMPLVPGVSFVNSIRDFADGDYIGGRCPDAGYPAGGSGHCPWGGPYVHALLQSDRRSFMIMIQGAAQFVAAFLGTVAFSVLFSVPKEHYPLCGTIGGLGWLICDLHQSLPYECRDGKLYRHSLYCDSFTHRKHCEKMPGHTVSHCRHISTCTGNRHLQNGLLYIDAGECPEPVLRETDHRNRFGHGAWNRVCI